MFENWNRFVIETQKQLKAKKPRDHSKTQPEQKKKQGKTKESAPPHKLGLRVYGDTLLADNKFLFF